MLQFHRVLCPIDFSDASARALKYATAIARWYTAQLEVLHVAPALWAGPAEMRFGPRGAEPPSHEQLLHEIEQAVADAGAGDLQPHARTEQGRPNDVIAAHAQQLPADLLVMGTHGRSGFSRALLGSVAEKVLRQVSCPVLTVPPAAPRQPDGPVTFSRIVCAVDYSPSALEALRYALELGRQAGGRVTVLHAIEYTSPEEPPAPSPYDPCREAILEDRRRWDALMTRDRTRLHAVLAGGPPPGCEADEVVVVGRAYQAILRHADEVGADLVVMGAQGTGGLELMLYGSNTQHVLRAAHCPVLTVRA